MEKNIIQVPVKVEISKAYRFADTNSRVMERRKDKNIIRIYKELLKESKITDEWTDGVEFCDDLYEELMSVETIERAQKIVEKLWDDRVVFSIPNNRTLHMCCEKELYFEVDTERFGELSIIELAHFKKVRDTYNLLKTAMNNLTNKKIVEKAFYEYVYNFENVENEKGESLLNKINEVNILYNNKLEQYVLVMQEDIESYEKIKKLVKDPLYQKRRDFLEDFFDDFPSITYTIEECIRYIAIRYIHPEIAGIKIRQDIEKQLIRLHCPTVLSAMYQKMLLASFNEDEYKRCKRCGKYFKVDKWHPQTMCDEHMESRRNKRIRYQANLALKKQEKIGE